jgi:hypothetical protein
MVDAVRAFVQFGQKSCGGELEILAWISPSVRFNAFWRGEMGRTKETFQWVTGAVGLSISGGSTLASLNVYFQ